MNDKKIQLTNKNISFKKIKFQNYFFKLFFINFNVISREVSNQICKFALFINTTTYLIAFRKVSVFYNIKPVYNGILIFINIFLKSCILWGTSKLNIQKDCFTSRLATLRSY